MCTSADIWIHAKMENVVAAGNRAGYGLSSIGKEKRGFLFGDEPSGGSVCMCRCEGVYAVKMLWQSRMLFERRRLKKSKQQVLVLLLVRDH